MDESKKFGIDLNQLQLKKFKTYMDFLLEYNSHTNLTAIKAKDDVIIKHFLDSMILNKFLRISNNSRIIDVGTGAGFPGVPLKILREDINLTLLDSLNKRIIFLRELIEKIDIQADIFHGRAEEFSHKGQFREKFDFVISRAVASLDVLSEYCLPYAKVGGFFVALKGPSVQSEINDSVNAIKILGGEIVSRETFELPYNKGLRNIVIVRKICSTLKNYPRSNSQISRIKL